MWTTEYIIAQLLGAIAFMFIGITYLIKNRNWILIFSTVGSACFLIHYGFLGAWAGVAVNVVNIIRAIILFVDEKRNKAKNVLSLCIILMLMLFAGAISIKNLTGIIAIVAGLIYSYALWQKDIFVYRSLSAFVNVLWLIYDCIFLSIIAICFDCFTITLSVVGSIIWFVTKKRAKDPALSTNKEEK